MAETVRVLLFATAREAVGRREVRVPVGAQGVPARELVAALAREFPKLASVARSCRLVVNGRLIDAAEVRVRPGDELALHPPYSGG